MGQNAICQAKVPQEYGSDCPGDFAQCQLLKFKDGLKAHPIFHGRFDNVPIQRIGLMVGQIYEILLYTAKSGIVMSFEKIFTLHVLMNITEAEMNIFFDIFLSTFPFQDDQCFSKYEGILDKVKETMLGVR